MGPLIESSDSHSRTDNTPAPMSEEERQLLALNTQLAQKQLDNINNLAPFQQQLVQSSMDSLKQQNDYTTAYNKLISPDQQAQAAADEFNRSQKLGPLQDELLQMQVDQMKQGGRATDQQKADIQSATDAAITAGTGDIDTQTRRGISMIGDELANSRGLRLSDTPIGSEAALLERAAGDQKSSLINNLRSNQANATLNYPLAVQGLQSGINMNQQNITAAAQNFQDQLRQQAAVNRQSMFGGTSSAGIGLSSVGNGAGASSFGALTSLRSNTANKYTQGYNPNDAYTNASNFAGALGSMMGG